MNLENGVDVCGLCERTLEKSISVCKSCEWTWIVAQVFVSNVCGLKE